MVKWIFWKKHRINYKFVGWSEVDKYCRISYKSNFNVINDFFIDDKNINTRDWYEDTLSS